MSSQNKFTVKKLLAIASAPVVLWMATFLGKMAVYDGIYRQNFTKAAKVNELVKTLESYEEPTIESSGKKYIFHTYPSFTGGSCYRGIDALNVKISDNIGGLTIYNSSADGLASELEVDWYFLIGKGTSAPGWSSWGDFVSVGREVSDARFLFQTLPKEQRDRIRKEYNHALDLAAEKFQSRLDELKETEKRKREHGRQEDEHKLEEMIKGLNDTK